MRTIPRDGEASQVRMALKRISDLFLCWNSGQFSNHACEVMIAIPEATLELDRSCRDMIRRGRWQAGLEESG